ncbi:hypothetical protein [Nocardia sp. NPDC004860]|uniref:hypothetical protein n=1 Tax=Nocardia sp. NPDC004860 TaxID=3154557 RepID=UPI0033AB161E
MSWELTFRRVDEVTDFPEYKVIAVALHPRPAGGRTSVTGERTTVPGSDDSMPYRTAGRECEIYCVRTVYLS